MSHHTMKTPILLNQQSLAQAIGVSGPWIRAMHRCGFPMPGGRATIADALQWLKEHPEFRMNKALRGHRRDRSNPPA